MKVKRYIARDAQEAMIKVKSELGRDAIILHTRKIKKQGIRAFFSKPLVEVVAAVEEDAKLGKASPMTNHNDLLIGGNEQGDIASFGSTKPNADILNTSNRNLVNIKQNSNAYQSSNDDDINQEIGSIKKMLSSVLTKINEGNVSVNVVKEDIKNSLLDVGISNDLCESILARVEEKVKFNEENREIIKGFLIDEIKNYMGKPRELTTTGASKPHIVFFIGPTGVGKTTTIAKLAAKESIINGKSVALITSDTYRIAAVDQLKTYSEILNVPISVIYETQDIKEEVNKYMDMDYIFVDTAGRNHKNKELIQEIGDLIDFADSGSVYLLLSLTTGYKDIESIVNSYKFIDDYNIIFTKCDEASALGNMLNIRHLTEKSLSYMTTGQSVPDDIEVVDIEKIANQMVGG